MSDGRDDFGDLPNTREEAIARAGAAHAAAMERLATRDSHEAALVAYVPGGPAVAGFEAGIRA
ncbi:hypothetical protein [Modestobacter sp. I12A-02662]|uniref:hypothetical protein n=1 Tax=Modestobacter sp. I12A-02662 TaxID=1730496 RepID=UPI0034DFABC0